MKDQEIKLPFVNSHAFVIGINDYTHITPLKTAINDAKGIAQRLETQHGYQVHGPLLNPTKSDLDKLFSETLPNEVGIDDRVVFYFAGHGIALDGEEGPNGYLVPVDAVQGDKETLVSMDILHQSLNDLPCRHGLLILDCCFSGAFKWSTGYRDVIFDLPKVIYEERFWRYVKDPAWQVITSSAYDQKAVDVISQQSIGLREEGYGMHSPFAKALFEAIEGAADVIPAEHGNGVITTSELYAYLRDSVESQTHEDSKKQSPSMFNLGRHDKGEFVFLNPRHRFNLPPTPDRNPFMGLASYNEADTHFFFGRDRVTEALIEKVQNNALTVVSGASGTGKSSVIKAGLLPQLRKEGWELLPVIRPGKEPLQVLGGEIGDISTKLKADQKTLLIIDQYEELITQCLYDKDREAFEQQLAKWLQGHSNLRIILSVRSDFEPQFESQALAPWWKKGRYVVPSFSLEEIRETITQPAMQAVLFYEPLELVDKLEEDVSQAPGALPLLSFTLSELYYAYLNSGRQDRALTLEDYEELGGVIGSLRSKADEAYLAQDKVHQNSMRKLMLRMVSLEGGELAGKRVYAEELVFNNEDETKRIKKLADQLVDARLILKGTDLQGRVFVEPAHDALVRAWARLWEWIKATGEEKISLQYKLSQAVNDYKELLEFEPKKAINLLWNNNPRLDLLNSELENKDHNLNAKEEDFVRSSVTLRSKKRRQFISTLIAVIIGLAGLAAVAVYQFYETDKALTDNKGLLSASTAKVKANSDPTHALRLAENAYDLVLDKQNTEVLQSLAAAFDGGRYDYLYEKKWDTEQGRIRDLTCSTNGKYIFTVSEREDARLWSSEGDLLVKFPAGITQVNFHPDEKHILAIKDGKTFMLWDLQGNLIGNQSFPYTVSALNISAQANSPKILIGFKEKAECWLASLTASNEAPIDVEQVFELAEPATQFAFFPSADSFLVLRFAEYDLFYTHQRLTNNWNQSTFEIPIRPSGKRNQPYAQVRFPNNDLKDVAPDRSSFSLEVDMVNQEIFVRDLYYTISESIFYPRNLLYSFKFWEQRTTQLLDEDAKSEEKHALFFSIFPKDRIVFLGRKGGEIFSKELETEKYAYGPSSLFNISRSLGGHTAPVNTFAILSNSTGKYVSIDTAGILFIRQSPESLWKELTHLNLPFPEFLTGDSEGIYETTRKEFLENKTGSKGWKAEIEGLELSDGSTKISLKNLDLIREDKAGNILQLFYQFPYMTNDGEAQGDGYGGFLLGPKEEKLMIEWQHYDVDAKAGYFIPSLTAKGILAWLEKSPIPSLSEIEETENKLPKQAKVAEETPISTHMISPPKSNIVKGATLDQIYGRVIGNKVRVRRSPEISSEKDHVIIQFDKGTRLEILGDSIPPNQTYSWFKVKTEKRVGWIREDFFEPEK